MSSSTKNVGSARHRATKLFLPEWIAQWGVMLTWPHAGTDWVDWLADTENTYAQLAAAISRYENLLIVAQDDAHSTHIRQLVETAGGDVARIRFGFATTDDTWARDHGPLCVQTADDKLLLLDFIFNGWGNKWPAEKDNAIIGHLDRQGVFDVAVQQVPLVMEGGALETDGRGTLLTTRRCLLSPQRNPQLDELGIEAALHEHLGIERILWLDSGHLEGDDTDSHIDTLARFADPETIVFQACDDPDDSHYQEFADLHEELENLRTADNKPYNLIPLPWPQAKYDPQTGQRLPATYANFLIINGAVLIPSYEDPADKTAQAVLAQAFPGREIIAIDCLPIIRGFGSLHCITMQLPEQVIAQ